MKFFITGGAGFIGCNSADYFLQQGHEVVVFDNLSRKGGPANLEWLRSRHSERLQFVQGDIREYEALTAAIGGADVVLHLASQVAVTTSVQNPREDFEINALGTFNVLEAVRHQVPQAAVLYASTNKVYGGMEGAKVELANGRYRYAEYTHGIPENYPLDFHSPYGCSKGTGDQYMLDYARIYGLKTMVFRQSCIYGQRQFGVEDQGWVAHFVIATVKNRPITIFGDGKQVRDLLHVQDLIRAYELGIQQIEAQRGEMFNVGGGPQNTLSIWTEFGPLLAELAGHEPPVTRAAWRPGDQRVFIADIRKAKAQLGWQPTISPQTGIQDLFAWVAKNPHLF
ncbi:MAG: GDP-mannose 4,6-dehydratase [Ardenticatenaceae bacterium]|nr:GDP-mannose 4,6-dehydratase [Anaerolineales bacterium]MCB8941348.1 GDP-mannose 4,6-dehydratase [Ardenticatenaceae bacterium]MCB8972704.1 GDP-mannose 4,6-dehydratase [Ardenticatenaceae bacterium]